MNAADIEVKGALAGIFGIKPQQITVQWAECLCGVLEVFHTSKKHDAARKSIIVTLPFNWPDQVAAHGLARLDQESRSWFCLGSVDRHDLLEPPCSGLWWCRMVTQAWSAAINAQTSTREVYVAEAGGLRRVSSDARIAMYDCEQAVRQLLLSR